MKATGEARPLEPKRPETRIAFRPIGDNVRSPVAAAVVDQDDLEIFKILGGKARERLLQKGGSVAHSHENRNSWGGSRPPLPPVRGQSMIRSPTYRRPSNSTAPPTVSSPQFVVSCPIVSARTVV